MTGCAAPVTTAVSATARSMGSAGTPIILISPRRTSLIAKRTAFTDTAATHTTGFPFFAPGRFDGNALSADLGVPHDGNHFTGIFNRHFHTGGAVIDINGANGTATDAGLSRNGAHDVPWGDAVFPAHIHDEANHSVVIRFRKLDVG